MSVSIEVLQVSTHRVGSAFVPRRAQIRLFGRKKINKAGAKGIEMKTFADVPVKRSREELGQQENPVVAGIETIADRNVHEAILARQRHRGFAPLLGEGIKARATPSAHDD